MFRITALILAAGYGSRIGKPKLMLEYKGENYLSLIIKNLRNPDIQSIYCVVNKDNIDWVKGKYPSIRTILNPNPEKGMLSSVYYGMKGNDEKSKGYLIIPVDHPFVKAETYDVLISSFLQNPDSIIKPSFKKMPGHPVIIPDIIKKNIPETGINAGLNKIIRNSGINQIVIETEDDGILKNVNLPEDIK